MSPLLRRARPMMGTLVGVSMRGDDLRALEDLIRRLFGEMERLEGIFSEFRPDSAVSAVNRSAGERKVAVPAELIEVLQEAERVSRASGGAFDCTWAALAPLWKIDAPDFRPPSADVISVARRLVDYREVEIDPQARTVFLRRRGMRLGFGGVAKAHIAERGADFAIANGARDLLIDAGGDLVARGLNGDRPWTIGIRDPRAPAALLGVVELRDESIATSGDYERFVEIDGRRYHHLLDPRTGAPALDSRSATVRAPHGALADALATALFVLGPAGLDLVHSFEGVDGWLLGAQGASARHSAAK